MGDSVDASEREKIRKALLDYCKQDTLEWARLLHTLTSAGEAHEH